MSAGIYDLLIEQGADFTRTFTWRDDNDALINLTGYTARMMIKASVDSPALVSLTDASGIVLGGAAGTIIVSLSATATAALSFSAAVYDLELVSGSGVVTRLLQGGVRLSREVTV